MKNTLIFLIITLAVLVSFVHPASAEVTFEKTTNVVEVLFKKSVKQGDWGWRQAFRFKAPTTTILKTCVDNVKYECFYEVDSRGEERKLYQYRAHAMVMVIYKFKTNKTAIATR